MAAMTRIERLLQERGATEPDQRGAHFVSALCVAWPDGHLEEVEARVDGTLVWPPRGTAGFGYDPVFLPDGHARTFGEMTSIEKHGLPPLGLGLSHRARAFVKLAEICLGCPTGPASGSEASLRRLRALAVLPVEMPVLRFQQPCPPCGDRRGTVCARLRARDRNHGGAYAGAHRLVDLSRRRHAVADAAADRRRHSRCDRQALERRARRRGDAGSQSHQRRSDALSRLSRSRRQPRLARRAGARRRLAEGARTHAHRARGARRGRDRAHARSSATRST